MEVAIDAGAEDLTDDGDRFGDHLRPERPRRGARRRSRRRAHRRVGRAHDGADLDRVGVRRGRGEEGAAADGRHRRPRRRPDRLRQLRHPRRRSWPASTAEPCGSPRSERTGRIESNTCSSWGSIPACRAAATGWSARRRAGRRARRVAAGMIETDPAAPTRERGSATLARELRALLAEFRPDVVVVERVFFQTNARTARGGRPGERPRPGRAAEAGCEVAQYTSNEVKLAVVGYGAATKEQVQRMVRPVLGLAEPPQSAGRRRRAGAGRVPPARRRRSADAVAASAGAASDVIGSLRGHLRGAARRRPRSSSRSAASATG